jgi:two-component system response regulator AtoC
MPDSWPSDGSAKKISLTVLVVEDEQELRGAIRDVLLTQGCVVGTAATGSEALRHVLGREYDVVICDIRLPKMDGLELTRLLTRRIRSPRILLMTAYPNPETVKECLSAGVAHVLAKPLSLTTLVRIVEGLLVS